MGDFDLIFDWVNDEAVRYNSFNQQQIERDSSKNWFISKLNSDNSVIFIYCVDEIPIGQVRIDMDNSNALITYSIDAGYRSQGHGGKILELLEDLIKNDLSNVKTLTGRVKKFNTASQKIFERLHYQCGEVDDYYEYTKEIEQN